MGANNFETLFGDNLIEDAGQTPPPARHEKPKLVSLRVKPTEHPLSDSVRSIPVGQIVVNEQHRAAFDEITELAQSIQELGLIQPLLVRVRPDQKFDLVAGERRLRAIQELGLEAVPCDVRDITDGGVAALQLAENLMRKDLNPIEEAKGFDDVIKKNSFTLSKVAKMYGRNKSTISRSLKLLELPAEIQEKVASGEVAPRAARELARLDSEAEQKETLQLASQKALTAEQTGGLVRGRKGSKTSPRSKAKTLTFDTDHGKLAITIKNDTATYEHVEAALQEALEEVQHRIKNRVTL